MKVEKKDLEKSQIELLVELSAKEFKPYIEKGALKISEEVKIDGFRPGKVPYEILKQKIGEMSILEEAARLAINKTIGQAIDENTGERQAVGQPKVDITKIAPGNPLEYKITVALLPEIKLGEYKDLKIKAPKTKVEDKEIEKVINDLAEMRVQEKKVDRELKDGDKVLVDMQMFLDKVPLEGGQAKDTPLIMGKNYIVPGFDKKILKTKSGETKEFDLPYPKDHHMKNIAGKMVSFKVTIKDIYERIIPEINNDFALGFGLKNIEELKKNIFENIKQQKEREDSLKVEKEMLDKIVSKSRFTDIPEILIDNETQTMLAELEQSVAQQGGQFMDYLKSIGKSMNELTLDLLPEAVKRVKATLLLREIGDVEKIKVKADEVEKQIAEIKKHYENQSGEQADKVLAQVDTPEYKQYVLNVLSSRKVIDTLKDWNLVK